MDFQRGAYLISIGLPPLGLLFAVYYFFDNRDDARQVAWTCVVLTAVALVVFYFTFKLFFSASGVNPEQLQQIKPSDIQQLYQ